MSGNTSGPMNSLSSRTPSGIGSNMYPNPGPLSGLGGPLGMSSGNMYGSDRFDAYKQPLGPMGRKF